MFLQTSLEVFTAIFLIIKCFDFAWSLLVTYWASVFQVFVLPRDTLLGSLHLFLPINVLFITYKYVFLMPVGCQQLQ